MIQVTTIVENTARKRNLLGEHGLAFWIETPTHRMLFDTGQGNVLKHNANALAINLAKTDAIVLSHGHYDHTGGLRQVLNAAARVKLCLHPDALGKRYSGRDGNSQEIGLASVTADEIRRREEDLLLWTTQPTEIVPGIFATGPVPRANDFEDTGGPFFLDEACTRPDPIADDQAIYFDTPAGVVVVLGCAHAGTINTLDYVRQLTGRPLRAILGGMHLVNAQPPRIDRTIAALRSIGAQLLAPGHCTGPRALAALWTMFPERISDCAAGTRWSFS